MTLKATIQSDMKTALRAGEKSRLGVIRMLLAAIQSREIESRSELSDTETLQVIEKLIKQRKDAAAQYADAGRPEREAAELAEAEQLQGYLPAQLSDAEIDEILEQTINATGATGMQDMGKVMAQLREKVQGRADMGSLSARVRQRLTD